MSYLLRGVVGDFDRLRSLSDDIPPATVTSPSSRRSGNGRDCCR